MMTARRIEIIDLVNAGWQEAVSDFIKTGCDVNEQGYTGSSAVGAAVERNDLKMLQILVEEGKAKLDITDEFGRSPLQRAERLGYQAIADYIKQALAAPSNLKKNDPWQPNLYTTHKAEVKKVEAVADQTTSPQELTLPTCSK